jgi:hypothetical protein
MSAGRYETGCPSIEESYKLDPRPGTLFTRAECEAKRGWIGTAVELYDAYLAQFDRLPRDKQVQQGQRASIARTQRATLAPQVPQITLLLVPEAPRRTIVRRDGREVAPATLGLALPVDPGEHVVQVTEPDLPPAEVRIRVVAGQKMLFTLPRPAPPSPFTPTRIAGISLGALGVVGLVVGAATGGAALAKKSVVKAHCNFPGDPYGCDTTGLAAANAGKTLATASTASLVVGAVAAATGVVLALTGGPKRPEKRGSVTRGGIAFSPDRFAFVF